MKIRYSAEELDDALAISETTETDVEIEHKSAWVTKRVYVCPRNIAVHRGNSRACGRQCRNAQGDELDDYKNDVVFKMMAIRKRTIFDRNVCAEGQ